MKLFRTFLILSLVALGFVAGYWYGKSAETGKKGGRRILYYVDPMHPAYKSDKPGIAPDCGMKLEPVYEDAGPAARHEVSAVPPGTIHVSPEKQQLIGVRYGMAESSAGVRTFRASGKVAYNETAIVRVHTRVEGWIDRVFADFTGQLVNKGQPLLTFYSPEMLATQQEFLLALKGKEIMRASPMKESMEHSDSLLQASRKRLELWDLSESQINQIARTNQPITNITLYSPIGGYVTARNAFPKQRVTPEMELYTIADLRTVWIMADVFENEAPAVALGQAVTIDPAYQPGKSLRAKVNYIQPQVDPMTRTLKIRLEAENPSLLLKPDMFVDVQFRATTPARVYVPAEAVLDTGARQTVFVDRGNGLLEPRQVEIGERLGDRIEIRKGLKSGERIVVSGNFLIDSESQLKAAMGAMGAHQHD
jgi:Cu(I)/Ag(I) efflux system membrane fusion protein